ncbi:MAG TPA: alpha/beta hydrolase-fold protein [Solirubrobacterales bacterium]|nr:alpha/beta hydrolase-fold protein [Solirubrobacterales bacterium]
MSDEEMPIAERLDRAFGGSPHSAGAVALRILAALLVIGAAFAIQRLWLSDQPPRETFGAKIHKLDVDSKLLGRTLPVRVVVPRRVPERGRGLLVFLHGRGEDERSYLVDPMFEALADLRDRAPIVAFPYGGRTSYWHNRENGQWAGYVLSELIPKLIRRYEIDPRKVAIGGISMGGFGAYDIARLAPLRFCAIGGHSPAIWESASETAEGAFDDADDFERNDIIAAAKETPSPYRRTRLWLDAGTEDPFLPGDEAFADALRASGLDPIVRDGPGGHDSGYWNDNWREYLGFYARALNNCSLKTRTTGARQPDSAPAGTGTVDGAGGEG